jgi:NADH-quinone oxidoreductase subunit A
VLVYLPILVMIGLVFLFVIGSFVASLLLAPSSPNAAKEAPYECGIVPEVEPAERFPVKFYLVAMSFIVLDVEIVFLYPFATVFRELGAFGLGLMAIFVAALLIPFGYLLSVGALSWGPRQVADTMRELTPVLRAKFAMFDPNKPADDAEGEPLPGEAA